MDKAQVPAGQHPGPFDDPFDAPRSDDPDPIADLRDALTTAGYTNDGVSKLLGTEASEALHRDLLEPALIVLQEREARGDASPALAALTHLFLLAQPTDPAPLPAELLCELRLARKEPDGSLRALVDLRPLAADDGLDCWLASDLSGPQLYGASQPLRRDHVVGLGPATLQLAHMTPRTPATRALDVGTGTGIQAMHLLRHTEHVTASDLSARALAFARFNLLLSATALSIDPRQPGERISLRQGDLLDPVRGERFDLLTSNPPFVITPRRKGEQHHDRYVYRDGGRTGDRVVQELVSRAGEVLEPGGIACLLGNWEIRADDAHWHERAGTWAADDMDLWIVQRDEVSPARYAEMWLRDATENAEQGNWHTSFASYLHDFAERGINRVGLGMIILRRPEHAGGAGTAKGTRRFEEISHALAQPIAPAVRTTLEHERWLRERDDAQLSAERLLVARDVTEERHARPGDEHPAVILLRQGGGFRRTYPVSAELAGFVAACDGELTAGQIITAIAAVLGQEEQELRSAIMPEARELIALGFLEPFAG